MTRKIATFLGSYPENSRIVHRIGTREGQDALPDGDATEPSGGDEGHDHIE